MANVLKTVGANICLHRKAKKWTQENLAEVLNSTGSYIGQIERGEKNVRIQTLVNIAEALDVNIASFFEHGEEKLHHPWVSESIVLLLQQNEDKQRMIYRVLCAMVDDEVAN